MKAGAFDYLSKPFIVDEIRLVVRRAIEHKQVLSENQALREQLRDRYRFDNIVGSSPGMVQVYKLIARVAQTDSTVLIQGESGTGKELVARAIHANSPRSSGPFVTVDSGALTESLLESELFGHERGAFTGAVAMKKGLLEKAHLGTCFFDEMANISPTLQSKLLRVLQEREFERVGGNVTIKVDVRVIAATNKNLAEEARAGRFREDLFYRLNVVPIFMPPLRDRKEDIPLLVEHFLDKHRYTPGAPPARISEEALSSLMQYDWPGNVRELENAIERAVSLAHGPLILPEDLPESVRDFKPLSVIQTGSASTEALITLEEMEKRYLARVLRETGGNKVRAAKILGIDRRTL
ncbi:MAG: two-component system response regulator, partial [Nitrospiraceae bacterium]